MTERRLASVILYIGLAILAVSGCGNLGRDADAKSQAIAARMSISAYSQARIQASGGAELQYSFPMLEIYNDSGVLVYQSREALANVRVLREFPRSVQNLQPLKNASRLAKLLEQISDFKAVSSEIRRKKWVILSIDLQDCEGCRLQESEIGALKWRLLQQPSISFVEIHVSIPGP
jgi:hypothetical protein